MSGGRRDTPPCCLHCSCCVAAAAAGCAASAARCCSLITALPPLRLLPPLHARLVHAFCRWVTQSVAELEVHSRIFDEMGFLPATPFNKINIHVRH